MALGFEFSEEMSGTYHRVGEPTEEHPFVFRVKAEAASLVRNLFDGKAAMTGTVEMAGVAERAALKGTLTMKPLLARFIRYEFDFTGDDGRAYHYAGEKTINHFRPGRSWTTLPGSVWDAEGKEVAKSVTYFDMKTLVPFLRSWKLRLR
ncbi:MAG: hypothetical protein KC466_08275 [Myxococcales bacterium]|nr:hypothetical protein [Myxococcales bacterium]